MRRRPAAPHDHDALRRLVNEAYLVEQFFVGGDRLSAAEFADLARKGTWLLGEDESGAIRACVYVEIRGSRGYFGPLAVDPSRQRTGWGRPSQGRRAAAQALAQLARGRRDKEGREVRERL